MPAASQRNCPQHPDILRPGQGAPEQVQASQGSAPDRRALARSGRAHQQWLRAGSAAGGRPARKVTNGYRAMWAAQGEADVRTVIDTARPIPGVNRFQTFLGVVST